MEKIANALKAVTTKVPKPVLYIALGIVCVVILDVLNVLPS